ncbi:hypothetical protein [Taibaiella soli]|uniref:Glycosyltransferase RgtA/B/C/D-like domain-containing protein n=1 Tax=Taibaiella soli TaxID=1649169 RepID=A0A2W2BA71_9BACT|nr:hypothetical protein [Taibaiella soli]PZF72797.1 hypothetical protein DN068_10290 [Taibaiella soli]
MNANPVFKKAAIIAVATLAILFLGALYFWRERALFVDDAFIPYLIASSGKLAIQEQRYGSFITQLVPLLSIKLHLPVQTMLLLYSTSFNLFFLLVIALLTFRYKQYALAVLMGLYYTIFVSDSFYWTNNEVHQGIAWMFLCLGVILWKKERQVATWQYAATILVFGGLAIFTHPLVGVILLYLIGFMFLTKRYWPFSKKESLTICLPLFLIFLAKFFISQNNNSYDSGKLYDITHTTLPLILGTFKGDAANSFFQDCKTDHWWIFIIIVLGLGTMLKARKWLLTFWTVLCSVAYFVFICLTFSSSYDFHTRFYMQSEWMGFAILLSAPFVFYFLPLLSEKKAALLLAAIFATRLIYIGSSSKMFTERFVYMNKMLQQMDKTGWTKVIIRQNQKMEDVLIMSWGLPIESMMIDRMNGHTQLQRTMITLPDEVIKERFTTKKNVFMSCFVNDSLRKLNTRYFVMDTVQQYRVVSEEQFWKGEDTGYVAPQKP